ncbi:MAG TPA: hypothetical protein PK677_13735 [Acidiphilium sp.]|nr:hypothetical protein [Acidiphilium sp.]HQU24957.1 hypothetical protein [Acidiphilium sp.]
MIASLLLLISASALGLYLAIDYLAPHSRAAAILKTLPRGGYGLIHAALGAAGLLLLIAKAPSPAALAQAGAGGFGLLAEWALGITLLLGAIIALISTRRRPPGLIIALHAAAAIAGVTLALAIIGLI